MQIYYDKDCDLIDYPVEKDIGNRLWVAGPCSGV